MGVIKKLRDEEEDMPAPSTDANAWVMDDANTWLTGLKRAEPDLPQPQLRVVRDEEPAPELPKARSEMASADPSFRPEPKRAPAPKQDDSGGYDWKRMLASLFGGTAGVADLDRLRHGQEQLKLQASKQAEDSRYRSREDSRAQGKYDAAMREQQKREELERSAMDPNSPTSQKMRDEFSTGLDVLGNSMPDQKEALAKLREKVSGMSALEIQSMQGRLGGVFTIAMNAGKAAADRDLKSQTLAGTTADRKDDNARGWALQREQERHNKAMEGAAATKIDAKVQGNQDKLNEKVESLGNMDDLLEQAIEAKKNVDVGPIATPFNKLRQYTPWPNEDFNTLQQSLGSVRNEIKLLKAGKAVTANEEKGLNEELANLEQMQDDPTFESKMRGMKSRIHGYKTRAVNQYQRKGSGETVDRSNTARTATKSAPSLTPGEETGAESIDPQVAEKVTLARQAINDPEASPEDKAAAQKILAKYGK